MNIKFNSNRLLNDLNQLEGNLKKIGDNTLNGAVDTLYDTARYWMFESLKVAPYLEGPLRKSGAVKKDEDGKREYFTTTGYRTYKKNNYKLSHKSFKGAITASVTFDGKDVPYIAKQHVGLTEDGRPFNYSDPTAKREFVKRNQHEAAKYFIREVNNLVEKSNKEFKK